MFAGVIFVVWPALQVVFRLFRRFGIPKYVPDEIKPLAKALSTKLIPALIPNVMGLLARYAAGSYTEPRVCLLAM